MLRVATFVENLASPSENESLAMRRVQAACTRFAGQVELAIADLDSDAALALGASIGPTIVVGETVIAVGNAPLAGQIKRFIEAALAEEGSCQE